MELISGVFILLVLAIAWTTGGKRGLSIALIGALWVGGMFSVYYLPALFGREDLLHEHKGHYVFIGSIVGAIGGVWLNLIKKAREK